MIASEELEQAVSQCNAVFIRTLGSAIDLSGVDLSGRDVVISGPEITYIMAKRIKCQSISAFKIRSQSKIDLISVIPEHYKCYHLRDDKLTRFVDKYFDPINGTGGFTLDISHAEIGEQDQPCKIIVHMEAGEL